MSLLHRLFCRSAATIPGRRRRNGCWALPESLERRLAFDVDLAVAIQDGVATYQPGQESVYTVIISNDGPDAVAGARVVAPLPTGVTSASWTAQYSPGASGAASGSSSEGEIFNEFITLPAGGSVIVTVSSQVDPAAVADITFEVDAVVPFAETDVATTNNTAADTNVRYQPVVVVGSDIGYRSTPTVTVIDPATGQEVNQFLAFESSFRGGVSTVLADVDQDGTTEVIAASGPGKGEVRVFELDGTELADFRLRPFGDAYFAGLAVAAGDFDGDGIVDLAVGKSRGADVAVFGLAAGATGWSVEPFQSFQPYGGSHINGVVLAAADVGIVAGGAIQDATTADGQHELVVATGAGASRPVNVLSLTTGQTLVRQIPADADYGLTGVAVAAARFDADAIDDIFVSGGRGASAVTDVYSGAAQAGAGLLRRYGAAPGSSGTNARSYASGIDLDGDGQVDQVYSLSGAGSTRGAVVFGRDGMQTNTLEILRSPLKLVSQQKVEIFDPEFVRTASGLQYRDVVVGTGAVAEVGQTLSVHYVGSHQNGEVFDSSRTLGTPFNFTLGAGEVIAGWDEGVVGMQVGGKRQLVIPPELAYGDDSASGRPVGVLVFDIELLSNGTIVRPPLG